MIHAHKCWMGTRSRLMLLGYWDVAGVSVTSTPMAKGEGDRRTCPTQSWCEHHLHPQHRPGTEAGEGSGSGPAGKTTGRLLYFLFKHRH